MNLTQYGWWEKYFNSMGDVILVVPRSKAKGSLTHDLAKQNGLYKQTYFNGRVFRKKYLFSVAGATRCIYWFYKPRYKKPIICASFSKQSNCYGLLERVVEISEWTFKGWRSLFKKIRFDTINTEFYYIRNEPCERAYWIKAKRRYIRLFIKNKLLGL